MNLQEMLGESFHEGMTIEEINTALSDKKFADLSTGNYVDANKYKADLQAKEKELESAKQELNSRMSDGEKKEAANAADKARIKELEDFIKKQTVSTNRDKAESLTADIRSILDIKDDDENYTSMLNFLSEGETEKIRGFASYINKLVKDSYEKGKKDEGRDGLGNFSTGVGKASSPSTKDEVGMLGKELAQRDASTKVDSNLYFKR